MITVLLLITIFILPVSAQEVQLPVMDELEFRSFIHNRLQNPYNPETAPITLATKNVRLADIIDVQLQGKGSEVIHIKVHDPQHKFMNGKAFTPNIRADKGTRPVGLFRIDDEDRESDEDGDPQDFAFCLKQNPEAPGLEIAYNLFLRRVVSAVGAKYQKDLENMVLPWAEVIVMNGSVFLLSKFIKGENLEDVLLSSQRIEELNGIFNRTKLTVSMIMAMIGLPEDQRLQNCILYENGNEWQFVPIDTERSFGTPYKEQDGIVTRAHSLFFCLPSMHTENPKDLFHMSRTSFETWFEQLNVQYNYQCKLKIYVTQATGDALEKDFTLGVSVTPPGFERMQRAKKIINAGIAEGKTFMQMLSEISSEVAKVYAPTKQVAHASTRYIQLAVGGMQSADTKLEVADVDEYGESVDSTELAPINVQQVLVPMAACVHAVDLGRISKKTPKSAGTIDEYLGKEAHTIPMQRNLPLCRLIHAHYSTPGSSPRNNSSSTAYRTLGKPVADPCMPLPSLTRQASDPLLSRSQLMMLVAKDTTAQKSLTPITHSRKLSGAKLSGPSQVLLPTDLLWGDSYRHRFPLL